eukprot:2913696-Amphidinium_carterae.1
MALSSRGLNVSRVTLSGTPRGLPSKGSRFRCGLNGGSQSEANSPSCPKCKGVDRGRRLGIFKRRLAISDPKRTTPPPQPYPPSLSHEPERIANLACIFYFHLAFKSGLAAALAKLLAELIMHQIVHSGRYPVERIYGMGIHHILFAQIPDMGTQTSMN